MHFKGNSSSDFVNELKKKNNSLTGSASYTENRIELFNKIYNTLTSGYSTDNLHYANILLCYYLATFCYAEIYHPQKQDEEDEIQEAIKYMHQRIRESLILGDLAKHVHRSSSHFSALFKQKTGYPPLEYFNHIKMQRACQILEFSNMQIKALAYHLGYNDPFYFSRLFTKFMGQSPVEYRKRKKFN